MTIIKVVCLIRFERRLSEVVSASVCTTPSPAQFHCDNVQLPRISNRSVAARLERLNSTRFTATFYDVDEHLDVGGQGLRQRPSRSSRTRTVASDALLADFGFIWIVFLTLDAFLVTRRIGNFFPLVEQQQAPFNGHSSRDPVTTRFFLQLFPERTFEDLWHMIFFGPDVLKILSLNQKCHFYFLVSGPCTRLSWPSRQLLSAR